MTQAFNELTKDTDQGKPLFDEAGNVIAYLMRIYLTV